MLFALLPEAPFLTFKRKDPHKAYARRRHSHRELSFGFILQGRTEVTINEELFSLKKNDYIIIPPDVAHLCIPEEPAQFSFIMFFIDPGWIARSLKIDPCSVVPVRNRCPRELLKLADHVTGEREELHTNGLYRRFTGYLSASIREAASGRESLGRRHVDETGIKRGKYIGGGGMEAVHDYISSRAHLPLMIEDLAEMAGMSRYAFIRKYSRIYGLTPHSDIINNRIRKSLSLFRTNMPFADIALECGFSDQSHFNRHFKLHTGILPGDYRRAILSKNSSALTV